MRSTSPKSLRHFALGKAAKRASLRQGNNFTSTNARAAYAAVATKRRSTEDQRPQLDAFAWRSVRRRGRIDERAVRRESGTAIDLRIVALEQQTFIRSHLGNVEPDVRGIESDCIALADAIAMDEIGRNEICRRDAARVDHRKRRVAHWPADRPPQIDDLHAPLAV